VNRNIDDFLIGIMVGIAVGVFIAACIRAAQVLLA
jgi:gas vesicle protein